MRPSLSCARLLCLLCAFLAAAEGRATPEPGSGEDPESALAEALAPLGEDLPSGWGNDFSGFEAFYAMRDGRFIRARELAQEILREDPQSIQGHVMLGAVLYRVEGSLALGRWHLENARELFEDRYGQYPGEESPYFWHHLTLAYLGELLGEMGLDEERLRLLDERDLIYGWQPAERAWPLMRLARYDEAVAAAEAGLLMRDNENQVSSARVAHCAIAAELLNREGGYRACIEALDAHGREPGSDPIFYSNAAEAALALVRLDEAENLYLGATRLFMRESPANPWTELMNLYVAEARLPEARDAMRKMFEWRDRQLGSVDVQTRSANDMASGLFLLAAGRPEAAAQVSRRSLDRPDRRGRLSFDPDSREGAAALLDTVASRSAAERAWERASVANFRDAWRARFFALGHELRAWRSGRRAAALLAEERRLVHTVLPYAPGSLVISEWIQPNIVDIMGPGVVLAALSAAEQSEPQPFPDGEGYRAAMEAEARAALGDRARARALAERALVMLPRAEVLLRAHVAARAGQVAADDGDLERSLGLFDRAMQYDPGIVRRLRIALPTRFDAGESGVARYAASLLRDSPRFSPANSGFKLQTRGSDTSARACLLGPADSLLACAEITARAGEDEEALARRLADELHERAFAPRVDLTQSDLNSLEGSTAVLGIRGTSRVRSLLEQLSGDGVPEADSGEEP